MLICIQLYQQRLDHRPLLKIDGMATLLLRQARDGIGLLGRIQSREIRPVPRGPAVRDHLHRDLHPLYTWKERAEDLVVLGDPVQRRFEGFDSQGALNAQHALSAIGRVALLGDPDSPLLGRYAVSLESGQWLSVCQRPSSREIFLTF